MNAPNTCIERGTDALCAAGFSQQDAQRADVPQLARAAWPARGCPESAR